MKTVLSVARLFLVLLCAMVGALRLEACTCGQRSACMAVAQASDVFLGTAQSEEPQTDGSFVTRFMVKETFKGKTEGEADVISLFSIECGMTRFRVGRDYLLFAGRNSEGRIGVGPCNPSIPAELAVADLRFLRKQSTRGTARTLLYGSVARIPATKEEAQLGFVPLAGTKIEIRSSSGVWQTVAGQDGTFQFEDLLPGAYTVEPKFADTLVERSLTVQLESNGCADALLTTFWNGRISGRAVAPNGQAVAGTDVSLITVGLPRGEGIAERTDDDGRFKFEGLQPGKYKVGLLDFDGLPSSKHPFPPLFYPDATDPELASPIELQPGEKFDNADFKIRSFGPREVRVEALWPDKRPAAGAEIHVEYEQSYCWKHGCSLTNFYESDQNGRVAFYAYGEGKVRVFAVAKNKSGEDWISDFQEVDLRGLPFAVTLVMSGADHYDRP